MRLIAIKPIRHGVGTILPGRPFEASGAYADRLINEGHAATEASYAALPWTGAGYWTVQPEWQGQTVAILGGGPSLNQDQVRPIVERDDVRVIAINNAVELAPEAEILYFCDARWLDWHRAEALGFKGWRVTLENMHLQRELEVRCLRDYGVLGFAPRNDGVTNGRNGGYQALHLATWLGAARVLLLGFDMREVDGRMHWHPEHPVSTARHVFPGWIESFESIAPELKRRGVEVINCTPDSALKAFRYQSLDAALGVEIDPHPTQLVMEDYRAPEPAGQPVSFVGTAQAAAIVPPAARPLDYNEDE